MKKVPKGDEPDELLNYRREQPQGSWEAFKQGQGRKKAVQKQLMEDQGGLCAYCEINLMLLGNGRGGSDFRVEHFHPKSDDSSGYNWHLDWTNLLACCHGGSSRNVSDSSRFTEDHSERSCDVPKGDYEWDEVILNPLTLPANIGLFQFKRSDGAMRVIKKNCANAGVDENRANASVERLQLNAARLCRLRQTVLNDLNGKLQAMCLRDGLELKDARKNLAKRTLRKDEYGRWPAFFSAIRFYLGSAAELHLKEIHYDG
jgi:uncharacterized protein (TIGR02646 family)